MSDQPEIATRLELLTREARQGSTEAAIALEEALRVEPPDELDAELERILSR
jgi:hypothetical protein